MRQLIFSLLVIFCVVSSASGIVTIDHSMTITSNVTWDDDVIVGYSGTGNVSHTSGTVSISRVFAAGYLQGSSGIYNLTGSGQLNTNVGVIGSGGTAVFNQYNGTHHSALGLAMGALDSNDPVNTSGGVGLYRLFGGTLTAPRLWVAESAGCNGWFEMSGGTLNLTGNSTIQTIDIGDGTGDFTMTGGDATFTNLTVNDRTIFDLTNDGTITITQSLVFSGGGRFELGQSGVLRISSALTNINEVESWVGSRLFADGDISVEYGLGYITATAVIPEPATLILLSLGGLMIRKR